MDLKKTVKQTRAELTGCLFVCSGKGTNDWAYAHDEDACYDAGSHVTCERESERQNAASAISLRRETDSIMATNPHLGSLTVDSLHHIGCVRVM